MSTITRRSALFTETNFDAQLRCERHLALARACRDASKLQPSLTRPLRAKIASTLCRRVANSPERKMPDPRIKPAVDEIKAVLAKHDLAAVVFIASPSHVEFLYRLEATWTCMRLEERGLRIRANSKDPAQVEALRVTCGTLAGFSDAARAAQANMDQLLAQLGQHVDIMHRSTRDG